MRRWWSGPRTENTEAGLLANGGTIALDPAKRVHIAAENIHWEILPEVLKKRKYVEEDLQRSRESGLRYNRLRPQKRERKKGDRLSVTDPW